MTHQNLDIILVANSPGELSALAQPVAQRFKEKAPEARIILFLTPCQYSSGNEVEFAKKNTVVDLVIPSENYSKWLLGLPLTQNITFSTKGVVVFLGGDLLHATLIAKRLGYKAYAYLANKNVNWIGAFEKFFSPKTGIFEKRIPKEKLQIIGDLMSEPPKTFSRTEALEQWKLDPKRKTVAFMPGSRMWEIKHMLPLYIKIVKILKGEDPTLQFMLIVSPFNTLTDFESFPGHREFDVYANFDSITAADLVITIPGTNTAQIGALGLPMLVLFPLDRPRSIPLEGTMHYITSMPILGSLIKTALVKIVNFQTRFFALPNIKADSKVVPEIRGKVSPQKAANKILILLAHEDELAKTSHALKNLFQSENASEKIVETILNEITG